MEPSPPETLAPSSTALLAGPRPPSLPRAPLRGLERVFVPFFDFANSSEWLKRLNRATICRVSKAWITLVTRHHWELHGMEALIALRPPRGVILVANHRTFWDMFVASAVLYHHVSWMQHIVFPVRADFFYSNPLGALLNVGIAGCGMWPPVFRDGRKPLLNPTSVQQMSWVVARQGTVLGMHPEGTRNKGDDPYTLLPPKPGVGQLVRDADPETVIVPFFLNGMSSDLLGEIRRNFRPEGQRGERFRFWFGAPIRVGDLDRSRTAMELSEELLGVIRGLAMQDRAQQEGEGAPQVHSAAW